MKKHDEEKLYIYVYVRVYTFYSPICSNKILMLYYLANSLSDNPPSAAGPTWDT